DLFMDFARFKQYLRQRGTLRELTFLFGDGFNERHVLTGGIRFGQHLQMVNEAGSPFPESHLPVRMVGDLLFKRTHPERYKGELQSYPFREDRIRIISTVSLDMRIQVNRQTTFMPSNSQASFSDVNTYTLRTLPAEIQKEIQEAYSQAERNFSGGQI
ncbi:MAG TPA: hypothetical protein VK171_05175, partial [Fimbriimonas sp.]|nr:hypothetical protein [Fimbriimonas sp.]